MQDAGFIVLVVVVFTLFVVTAVPGIYFVNRALGAAFDDKARAIAPLLAQEGIVFAEDAVKIRGSWIAPLAVGVRWTHADVRVTRRAIYLMQYTKNFGSRMGQPIIALPLRGAQLDPAVAARVTVAWLQSIETSDAAYLTGTLRVQRFSMRLAVRDVAGFARATA